MPTPPYTADSFLQAQKARRGWRGEGGHDVHPFATELGSASKILGSSLLGPQPGQPPTGTPFLHCPGQLRFSHPPTSSVSLGTSSVVFQAQNRSSGKFFLQRSFCPGGSPVFGIEMETNPVWLSEN